MAIQKTTPGSYEAPVEGIVDYNALSRGFDKGIAPGLKFMEDQEKEKKELEKEANKIKIDTSVSVFGGVNKNTMTGDANLETNTFLEDDAASYFSSVRPEYIKAYKAKDQASMDKILRNLALDKASYSNLSLYVSRLGDPEVNDGNVSNTRFIDENGDQIEFNGADFTSLNNNNPKLFKKATRLNKDGQVKSGFTAVKDGKTIFLNTQDMDEAYLNKSFRVKADQQRDIISSTGKDGVSAAFNRTPNYNVSGSKTVEIVGDDGTMQTVSVGDSTKYIRPEFYTKSEQNAQIFAQDEYGSKNDALYESAWNQFTNDKNFVPSKQIQSQLLVSGESSGINYRDPVIAKDLGDEFKLDMLRDYAAEKWKITVANAGYVKGDDGRALSKNVIQYRSDKGVADTPAEQTGDKGNALTIVEDLNTQFNAITSDAEREFKKSGYKPGATRGGEGEALQMYNFLTNKSYMKGGSEKSIDDLEYRIVGEGEDRKIFLDLYSTSGAASDKIATVDLSDAGARRDFLTNIGQGLAVTSSEKQAVREETKALTSSRQEAFVVFKDITVGDKDSSRWNVLAKAIRNNSSEGLNKEERRVFLMAGYGKKQ
tara:strand:+ start:10367 stop:12154 length:1788 start_codon:yes stop_codon:yes gene_type:complete